MVTMGMSSHPALAGAFRALYPKLHLLLLLLLLHVISLSLSFRVTAGPMPSYFLEVTDS